MPYLEKVVEVEGKPREFSPSGCEFCTYSSVSNETMVWNVSGQLLGKTIGGRDLWNTGISPCGKFVWMRLEEKAFIVVNLDGQELWRGLDRPHFSSSSDCFLVSSNLNTLIFSTSDFSQRVELPYTLLPHSFKFLAEHHFIGSAWNDSVGLFDTTGKMVQQLFGRDKHTADKLFWNDPDDAVVSENGDVFFLQTNSEVSGWRRSK